LLYYSQSTCSVTLSLPALLLSVYPVYLLCYSQSTCSIALSLPALLLSVYLLCYSQSTLLLLGKAGETSGTVEAAEQI